MPTAEIRWGGPWIVKISTPTNVQIDLHLFFIHLYVYLLMPKRANNAIWMLAATKPSMFGK